MSYWTLNAFAFVVFMWTLTSGVSESAILIYRFTSANEVDLVSTFVPEACRGQGVAALLSKVTEQHSRTLFSISNDGEPQRDHVGIDFLGVFFCWQAALDFVLEEKLKARVSCWYIKKYMEEHPHHHNYKEIQIRWRSGQVLLAWEIEQ